MNHTRRNNSQAVSLKKRFFSAPTLLSFGIAAALIAFLAVRVDLDWGAAWDNVRGMNPWLYLLAFFLYYVSFLFRGLRWRLLARNAGIPPSPDARLPSVRQCSQLILIGWFVNSIAWLRLGDAYRAYAFSKDSRGGFPWALGTILAERVIDMATVFGLLLVSALWLSTTSDSTASGYVLTAAFAISFALLTIIVLMKVYGTKAARFLPARFEAAYERFHRGAVGGFRQLPLLATLSLAGWFMEMARLYFVVQALDLSISLALVTVVALGHALLSTVPTPGGIGVVEPGVTGLLMLSLERHDAVSVALVDRSITYVSVIIIGGIVFALRQVAQGRVHRQQTLATEGGTEPGDGPDS